MEGFKKAKQPSFVTYNFGRSHRMIVSKKKLQMATN